LGGPAGAVAGGAAIERLAPVIRVRSANRGPREGSMAGVPDVGNDVAVGCRAAEQRVRSLRVVLDILVVCDMALRMQGAEQDQEIADVLRHCGSYRLGRVIEEMEALQRVAL
jgi:hypothetical protein